MESTNAQKEETKEFKYFWIARDKLENNLRGIAISTEINFRNFEKWSFAATLTEEEIGQVLGGN